jgi:hypothetical protein
MLSCEIDEVNGEWRKFHNEAFKSIFVFTLLDDALN